MMDEKVSKEYENDQSENKIAEDTEATVTFKVTIPEEETEVIPEEKAEEPKEEEKLLKEVKPSEKKTAPAKPQGAPVKRQPSKTAPVRRKVSAKSQKQIKSEKTAKNTVMILSCLMALITIVTAVVGSLTDVFKNTDVDAVAVLVLPQEDKAALEEQLSKLGALAETGFDTQKMSEEELFGYIKPYSKGGLYASFGYESQAVTQESDPAERFRTQDGTYSYFKIAAKEIDSIMQHFGLEANHTVNTNEVYYYDGFYYFSQKEDTAKASNGKVSIVESKRIQDGGYYVTAKIGGKKVYVVAGILSTDNEKMWKIESISLTPKFDNLGVMIQPENEAESNYEMRSTIIEGKVKDGTVFRKYIVKYPYFFGDSQGEIEANNFYSSVITFYQQQSQQLQSEYNKFKKKGGKADSLPVELHYSAQISYSDEANLCLINEITESVAMYNSQTEDEIKLPSKTIECNTFEVETGLYASKDNLIGKDYITASKILYRIYGGYGYQALLDSGVTDEYVPEDSYKLGEKIYNSASTFCEDGYVFCYVNSKGIREDVVIPFEDVEKLKAKQQ